MFDLIICQCIDTISPNSILLLGSDDESMGHRICLCPLAKKVYSLAALVKEISPFLDQKLLASDGRWFVRVHPKICP